MRAPAHTPPVPGARPGPAPHPHLQQQPQQRQAPRPASAAAANPRAAQRLGAFATFDLDRSGAITQHDLPCAFMAYHGVEAEIDVQDIAMALHQLGMRPGQLVDFGTFCALCDLFEQSSARREREESARRARAEEAQQPQPRAAPQPPHPQQEEAAQAGSGSPRGPRACLATLPGMDAVANAFYMFDLDQSGEVSACELPGMLAVVPRKRGGGTLAYPAGAAKKKQAERWEAAVRDALGALGKLRSDLLSLADFREIVDAVDPAPADDPQPPPDAPAPAPEVDAAAEEERRQREEAEREADRRNAESLIVKLGPNTFIRLEGCSSADTVDSVTRKIQQQTGTPASAQRLLGRGFELSPRFQAPGGVWRDATFADYGITVGHPHTHKGDVVELLLRAPPPAPTSDTSPAQGQVRLQRSGGGTLLPIPAVAEEPIEALMRRIEHLDGTPAAAQRLLHAGRELNPRRCLADYQVSVSHPGDLLLLLSRDARPPPIPAG
eukprot:TRINITY_DN8549_c0_g1_i1.p1 TRINITY_DN8549_c0_g1~~TRINITY_DN8549_c0_g1_i1.p1  ORF type:complete len:526 (+),score=116.65 TRINITY_DN8549_c0_g1_i1:96-1580(+)